jgi:hypothetical protein
MLINLDEIIEKLKEQRVDEISEDDIKNLCLLAKYNPKFHQILGMIFEQKKCYL